MSDEMELKDLTTFLEAEEEKAISAHVFEKHFKELGEKRARAFRQIRQHLQQKPEINEAYMKGKVEEMAVSYGFVSQLELDGARDFITQIIRETRGLQEVPVVRIKPERMDYMDKGALIGKPREVKIKKKGD